ncbi:Gfo/Idh/MocA family oxidoreductase [Streptomyces sp. NPDC005012]|jgi:myo-inositol 2-dehydrogenase/D-chiro-inositol 1-dehydrogenase|uniref:Gfo/Idh/MocA family protein n=1 Tax=unclassified Streptomyces TaxID=2593676 RepID=UPI0033A6FE6B
MRIGVIGTGRIGALHAHVLSRHSEVGSLVVTDTDQGRAHEIGQRLGATVAPGVNEVFNWGVDAVVITAATSAHSDLIRRAARYGLPAFCEKPIALDLRSTLEAIADVEAAGTVLQMGFQRRFDAAHVAAQEAVWSGRLGRLHTVRALSSEPAPPPAEHLALSGGLYRDVLIHDFDTLRWVTGREVAEVYAAGSAAGPEMFRAAGEVDTGAVLITLEDGTLATVTGTRLNGSGYDQRMELAGELDQMVVGLDERTPFFSAGPGGPVAAEKPWSGFLERFAPAYQAELYTFLDVVRGARPNPCDGRQALEALRIAEACELSRREHRPVHMGEIPQSLY